MNDAEYRAKAESLYQTIEDVVDQFVEEKDAQMDYENSGGVLTIFLEDTDTQVIISRQAATQQIWVAAKSGGFHCTYEGESEKKSGGEDEENKAEWRCTKTQETLDELLSRTCSEQTSVPIIFPKFG